MTQRVRQWFRSIGAVWGIGGVVALFGWAIFRLAPHTVAAWQQGLTGWQILLMVSWCIFMVYTEGYRGIGKSLAGRIAERALHVYRSGDWLEIALAPLYVLGYFRATRRRLIISYTAIGLIICAVIVVHQLSQPWRGIVDAGVVLGLAYGMGAILWRLVTSFANHQLEVR